jgi:hypothetical protein
MALRRFSHKTNKIKSLFFQSLVTEDIEEAIDLKISSGRVSGKPHFKAKNYREI